MKNILLYILIIFIVLSSVIVNASCAGLPVQVSDIKIIKDSGIVKIVQGKEKLFWDYKIMPVQQLSENITIEYMSNSIRQSQENYKQQPSYKLTTLTNKGLQLSYFYSGYRPQETLEIYQNRRLIYLAQINLSEPPSSCTDQPFDDQPSLWPYLGQFRLDTILTLVMLLIICSSFALRKLFKQSKPKNLSNYKFKTIALFILFLLSIVLFVIFFLSLLDFTPFIKLSPFFLIFAIMLWGMHRSITLFANDRKTSAIILFLLFSLPFLFLALILFGLF